MLSGANEVAVICAAYLYSEHDSDAGVYPNRHALEAIRVLGAASSYEAYFLAGDG